MSNLGPEGELRGLMEAKRTLEAELEKINNKIAEIEAEARRPEEERNRQQAEQKISEIKQKIKEDLQETLNQWTGISWELRGTSQIVSEIIIDQDVAKLLAKFLNELNPNQDAKTVASSSGAGFRTVFAVDKAVEMIYKHYYPSRHAEDVTDLYQTAVRDVAEKKAAQQDEPHERIVSAFQASKESGKSVKEKEPSKEDTKKPKP